MESEHALRVQTGCACKAPMQGMRERARATWHEGRTLRSAQHDGGTVECARKGGRIGESKTAASARATWLWSSGRFESRNRNRVQERDEGYNE